MENLKRSFHLLSFIYELLKKKNSKKYDFDLFLVIVKVHRNRELKNFISFFLFFQIRRYFI